MGDMLHLQAKRRRDEDATGADGIEAEDEDDSASEEADDDYEEAEDLAGSNGDSDVPDDGNEGMLQACAGVPARSDKKTEDVVNHIIDKRVASWKGGPPQMDERALITRFVQLVEANPEKRKFQHGAEGVPELLCGGLTQSGKTVFKVGAAWQQLPGQAQACRMPGTDVVDAL